MHTSGSGDGQMAGVWAGRMTKGQERNTKAARQPHRTEKKNIRNCYEMRRI